MQPDVYALKCTLISPPFHKCVCGDVCLWTVRSVWMSTGRFFIYWSLQAVWVAVTLLPVLLLNTATAGGPARVLWTDVLGACQLATGLARVWPMGSVAASREVRSTAPGSTRLEACGCAEAWRCCRRRRRRRRGRQGTRRIAESTRVAAGAALWASGFTIEAVADAQKWAFKRNPANEGRFIDTGLWSLARYPNYGGEMMLWQAGEEGAWGAAVDGNGGGLEDI